MALKKKKSSAGGGKRLPVIFAICSIVLVLIIGLVFGYLYLDTRLEHDNILENISVAGVDVGGMSKEEALAAVRSATAHTYIAQPLTIVIAGDEYTISPSLSGAELDVEAAVEAAYEYGRRGFLFQRKQEQMQLDKETVHVDILGCLNLNTDAIRQESDKLAAKYNSTVVHSTYRLEGQMPASGDAEGSRTLVIQLGIPGYATDTEALYQQILAAYNTNQLKLTAPCQITEPKQPDLELLAQQECTAAVDATLNETTYEITDHIPGYGFEPDEVRQALDSGTPGQEYTFPFHGLAPAVSREDLEAKLFKDVLSEYTAEYGSSYNRDENLRLSCQAVNGTILLPGESFDYNTALGERTPEAGYRLGNTYSGMETIQTYGGGICQTSSTLYYCAMMADLEIVQRTNHGFISTYVPYGMDATVSWGGPEFKFRNNSDYPIKIEAYSNGGDVTVRLLGTDDKDYYVKMEYEVLGVHGWKTVEQTMAPDNAKGYKDGQVITSPYTGYTVQTYRCKYDKATDTLISREEEAYSVYSTRNKVVCKIVETQPEPSTPTTPTTPATPTTPTVPTEPSTTPSESTVPSESTGENTEAPQPSVDGSVTEDG